MLAQSRLDSLCPLPPDPDELPRVLTRADALTRFTRRQIDPVRRLAASADRHDAPVAAGRALGDGDRARAALAFAGGDALLSGSAALWAAEVPRIQFPRRVLVLVRPSNRTGSTSWVVVRRTSRPLLRQQWTGPARVEVARATADAALEMRDIDDVRTLLARVVRSRSCTLAELGLELADGPRRGSRLLRQVLEEVGSGAASAPEARAAAILRRAGITGFVQNAEVRMPDGSIRIVDFYWPQLRACLEIDSVEWHTEPAGWSGTWDRHMQLTTLGLSVIHRPPSALRDPARFAGDVAAWLTARERELRFECARSHRPRWPAAQ